jgi:hypothetical protein
MFLDGRPPLNVGVTSGGNFFGSTAVSFTDVLGDRRVDAYFGSMSQYRVYGVSLINLERRLNYAIQGYWQDEFYYGQTGGVYYDPIYSPYIDRDLATSTRSNRGASAFGIYPLIAIAPRVSDRFGYIREQQRPDPRGSWQRDYQRSATRCIATAGNAALGSFVRNTIFRERALQQHDAADVRGRPGFSGNMPRGRPLTRTCSNFKIGSPPPRLRGRGSGAGARRRSPTSAATRTPGLRHSSCRAERRVATRNCASRSIEAMATPTESSAAFAGWRLWRRRRWWDNSGYKFATTAEIVTPSPASTSAGDRLPIYRAATGGNHRFRLVDGRASTASARDHGPGSRSLRLVVADPFNEAGRTPTSEAR